MMMKKYVFIASLFLAYSSDASHAETYVTKNNFSIAHVNGAGNHIRFHSGGNGLADCELRVVYDSAEKKWKPVAFKNDFMTVEDVDLKEIYTNVIFIRGKYISVDTNYEDEHCGVGVNFRKRYYLKK